MRWDPRQYGRYADERGRPFVDLIDRIGIDSPRRIVDVGCGPGNLTALLARRWPAAVVEGLDSSPEMIDAAAEHVNDRLHFRVGDAVDWLPAADVDLVVSNATLQWVPAHRELVCRWADALPRGGWLAFQLPGNFSSPSHVLMRSLAESARWRGQLDSVLRHDDIGTPTEYAQLLMDSGLTADTWKTTYTHVLRGDDPVLQWVRGTGLRPVLQALDSADGAEFEREYAAQLRVAYPPTPYGRGPDRVTLFTFRRIFAVGHKP